MAWAQTDPLHRLLVETHAGVRDRLAVGADHAIGRIRRRHTFANPRIQLGVEPVDGPEATVYRLLLVRAHGYLPDRALHVAG